MPYRAYSIGYKAQNFFGSYYNDLISILPKTEKLMNSSGESNQLVITILLILLMLFVTMVFIWTLPRSKVLVLHILELMSNPNFKTWASFKLIDKLILILFGCESPRKNTIRVNNRGQLKNHNTFGALYTLRIQYWNTQTQC